MMQVFMVISQVSFMDNMLRRTTSYYIILVLLRNFVLANVILCSRAKFEKWRIILYILVILELIKFQEWRSSSYYTRIWKYWRDLKWLDFNICARFMLMSLWEKNWLKILFEFDNVFTNVYRIMSIFIDWDNSWWLDFNLISLCWCIDFYVTY